MASYTTVVKDIYEKQLFPTTWENCYTIFNESYRNTLNEKIKLRYWYNEIGFSEVDRWNFELSSRLNIIMPYYNDLYNSYNELKTIGFNRLLHDSIGSDTIEEINVNGFNNTDFKTDNDTSNKLLWSHDKTDLIHGLVNDVKYNSKDTNEQEKDSKNLQLSADTPMSEISESLQADTWSNQPFVSSGDKTISNSGKNVNSKSGNDTTTSSGTDTTIRQTSNENLTENDIKGYNNSTDNHDTIRDTTVKNYDYMETYKKILDILTNIDEMIINNLRDLFLTVYK